MKKVLLLILPLFSALCASATDYVSNVTAGNWNNASSWTPSGVPSTGDNVTILNGHTITLTNNASCNNLTLNGISGTRLVCDAYLLDISGTLTGPGGSFDENIITSTSTVGRFRFVGGSRALFASWGAFGRGCDFEVALDGGAAGTVSSNIKARNVYITSGTLDMLARELRIDGGSDGTGIIWVQNASVLKANRVGERTSSAGTYCGTVTVDGTLEIYGSILSGNTININGTLRQKSANALISNPGSALSAEFNYGSIAVVEYNAASGNQLMGAETGRASVTDDPIIPTMRINTAASSNVSTNARLPKVSNLDFVSGKVSANSNITVVAGGSITGESASTYVITGTGSLVRNDVGATDTEFPVGTTSQYLPVLINNAGTADHFAVKATSSAVPPSCLTTAPNVGSNAIQAAWDIAETVSGGSNCTITLDYQNLALRGSTYNPNTAQVVHCLGTVANYAAGGPDAGTSVTGSGFTEFSPFGIGSATVLPLEWGAFTGQARADGNLLHWQTLTERHTDHFVVERGSDAQGFTALGTVPAAGNAQTPRDYTFRDVAPLREKNYYRLKIMDLDGGFAYSPIIGLRCPNCSDGPSLYPMPTTGTLFLTFDPSDNRGDETWSLTLYDLTGRVLRTAVLEATTEGAWPFDLSSEKPGTYLLWLTNGAETWVRRVVREE